MPNYVLNTLKVSGNQLTIDVMLAVIKYDDKLDTIDFNKIIPMPASLNITSSSNTPRCIETYLKAASPYIDTDFGVEKMDAATYNNVLNKLRAQKVIFASDYDLTLSARDGIDLTVPETRTMLMDGKIYVDNVLRYGAPTWYEWHIEHWGSKWNSINPSPSFEKNILIFDTAWSNVTPVIVALSKMYPTISFEYAWADEDFGSNVGKRVIENGKIITDDTPTNCSKHAYELAAEIREESIEDYGLIYDEALDTYVYAADDM